MCVRFIHFSRDLTFYYACALRLEGEKVSSSFMLSYFHQEICVGWVTIAMILNNWSLAMKYVMKVLMKHVFVKRMLSSKQILIFEIQNI